MDVGLVDPAAPKDESLGHIRISLQISPVSGKGTIPTEKPTSRKVSISPKPSASSKLWSELLTITLIEGRNLPAMDRNGEYRMWVWRGGHGHPPSLSVVSSIFHVLVSGGYD